ncbi:hypothetical protein LIER_14784 [Lithospermum erythrorhizon]|uniref:Reverse transcriptase domain-containing protein n=1 Tax=Lithospermum erythrorhizon TaxID=34254 RepID=A0AAV3Q0D4_LITER
MFDFNTLKQESMPIKYQPFWSSHKSFQEVLKRCWESEVEGNCLEVLHQRMKCVKHELKKLNNEQFSQISFRFKEKQFQLDGVNCQMFGGDVAPALLARASDLEMDWYKEGDANTGLFHYAMRIHQVGNRITHMSNNDGVLVKNYVEVEDEDSEDETTMMKMKIGKAPDHEGFSVEFYKDTQPVIKESVELVCDYHKNSGRPRCAIKVDLMKAYDIVNWEFLWKVLEAMDFPAVFA